MNIAYFTDMFLPQVNGVATSIATFSKELGRRGHRVVIFTPEFKTDGRTQFKARNVRVVSLPSLPALIYPEYRLSIFGLPKILQVLRSFRPDIIHFHTPMTVGFDALLTAKILDKPLVGTFHAYITTPDYLSWIKNRFALKVVTDFGLHYCRFFYDACALSLAPSRTLIHELYEVGYKRPVEYLPNAIAFSQLRQLSTREKKLLKKRYGLRAKVILHVGRLSPEKRVDLVIQALSLLVKKNRDMSLLLIGDGPSKEGLQSLSRDLGIEEHVVFTGFIDYPKMLSSGILSVADLFMTASTMENQSMACLEAMSYGLPLVAVKAGGMREMVSTNGYLTKEGDIHGLAKAAEKILCDELISKKMQQASLEKAKLFSVETVTNTLVEYYNRLIS